MDIAGPAVLKHSAEHVVPYTETRQTRENPAAAI